MHYFIIRALILLIMVVSLPYEAQAERPGRKSSSAMTSCNELRDDKTYGSKYNAYRYLIPGKDGWVFRSGKDLKQKFSFDQNDALIYKAFSDTLKSKGTTLVLSIIPTRGMIAHQKLPDDDPLAEKFDRLKAKKNYDELIQKLNRSGILAVGTSSPASGASYFNHADQHWTTTGAREMAFAIADVIKAHPGWKNLPKGHYETTTGRKVAYDGRFSEMMEKFCDFRLPQETDSSTKTVLVSSVGQSGLFENSPAPKVVLVGTSNSWRDEFDANFGGYLKEALSADVLNAAISGGGMDDSLLAYLDSDHFKKTPPTFLIWEIPVYYNLGGEGMGDALRQGIASVYGYCQNPLYQSEQLKVVGERVYFAEGIEAHEVKVDQSYLAIKFDGNVKKDFSVVFKTDDGENRSFKFKRRREEHADTFYYIPTGKADSFLMDVGLNTNKNIMNMSVEARLCELPMKVR